MAGGRFGQKLMFTLVFNAVLDPQLCETDIKHCTPDLLGIPHCANSGSIGRQDWVPQVMVCWESLEVSGLHGIGCSAPF